MGMSIGSSRCVSISLEKKLSVYNTFPSTIRYTISKYRRDMFNFALYSFEFRVVVNRSVVCGD